MPRKWKCLRSCFVQYSNMKACEAISQAIQDLTMSTESRPWLLEWNKMNRNPAMHSSWSSVDHITLREPVWCDAITRQSFSQPIAPSGGVLISNSSWPEHWEGKLKPTEDTAVFTAHSPRSSLFLFYFVLFRFAFFPSLRFRFVDFFKLLYIWNIVVVAAASTVLQLWRH